MSSTSKILIASCVAALCAGTLAGCASTAGPTESPSVENTTGLPAPIAIDLAQAEGKTFTIPKGNTAYIIVAEGTEAKYNGRVLDPVVVQYVPGSDEENLVLRPGLRALHVGKTQVQLTNTQTNKSTSFFVTVPLS